MFFILLSLFFFFFLISFFRFSARRTRRTMPLLLSEQTGRLHPSLPVRSRLPWGEMSSTLTSSAVSSSIDVAWLQHHNVSLKLPDPTLGKGRSGGVRPAIVQIQALLVFSQTEVTVQPSHLGTVKKGSVLYVIEETVLVTSSIVGLCLGFSLPSSQSIKLEWVLHDLSEPPEPSVSQDPPSHAKASSITHSPPADFTLSITEMPLLFENMCVSLIFTFSSTSERSYSPYVSGLCSIRLLWPASVNLSCINSITGELLIGRTAVFTQRCSINVRSAHVLRLCHMLGRAHEYSVTSLLRKYLLAKKSCHVLPNSSVWERPLPLLLRVDSSSVLKPRTRSNYLTILSSCVKVLLPEDAMEFAFPNLRGKDWVSNVTS